MADITVTAANVLATSTASTRQGTAGAAVTAGQSLYSDSTANGKLKPADADVESSADAVGIALHASSTDQPLTYATAGGVDCGATLVIGETYAVSTTAGGIAPIADLITGDFITILGVATAADNLAVSINSSGTARA